MRWNRLFDDLEVQLDRELDLEDRGLRQEEERLRLGRLSLRERIAALAAPGEPAASAVRVEIGDETFHVRPTAFGRDWLAGDIIGEGPYPLACVIPFASVTAIVVTSESRIAASLETERESTARLMERIGLVFALRDLCRRRVGVSIVTVTGRVHGTIDRVARDHIDLAVHERGVPRRTRDVAEFRILPLTAIRYLTME
ncbi:hypothetical protein [Agromyces atrinae]|uniref:Uncharacterized protein n=1 Tax=Agromyces atrinae TaxID=592376 RepID=A0A4Q2MA31_9MICO|nr:hypothetical protein [Agromyces atrinae]NYD66636.1 hypothetical protein [Agromyces atrinae]RXZ87303.1 hypothetical protein ESP50_05120 [Agromyces atrinae]